MPLAASKVMRRHRCQGRVELAGSVLSQAACCQHARQGAAAAVLRDQGRQGGAHAQQEHYVGVAEVGAGHQAGLLLQGRQQARVGSEASGVHGAPVRNLGGRQAP